MSFFCVPKQVGVEDKSLGAEMVKAWRKDGFFYINIDTEQDKLLTRAFGASRSFMKKPVEYKRLCINDLSFSGYYVGNEYTIDAENNGRHIEAWETYNICKDLPMDDRRVIDKWPCHGPVPWPSAVSGYRNTMQSWLNELGQIGTSVVELIALALGLNRTTISALCVDGWHRLQTLHYPARDPVNIGKGLSSHTDNGMLVLLAQDPVGGLHVRPPIEGELRLRNWLDTESTAGMYEDVEPWHFVVPRNCTLVCFPGDTFQLLTDSFILATPHKVSLNSQERFSFAYFHEPNFNAVVRSLVLKDGSPSEVCLPDSQQEAESEQCIYYGRFFTSLWTRSYPLRPATRRILHDDPKCRERLAFLQKSAFAVKQNGNESLAI
ncbi:hypothetical protein GPALN_016369 [Globodera pallida]|nr:hypothetical protein GPALN_016369 [Globodera pallida]